MCAPFLAVAFVGIFRSSINSVERDLHSAPVGKYHTRAALPVVVVTLACPLVIAVSLGNGLAILITGLIASLGLIYVASKTLRNEKTEDELRISWAYRLPPRLHPAVLRQGAALLDDQLKEWCRPPPAVGSDHRRSRHCNGRRAASHGACLMAGLLATRQRAGGQRCPVLGNHGLRLPSASVARPNGSGRNNPKRRKTPPTLERSPGTRTLAVARVRLAVRPGSQAEIPSDGALDFGELVSFEVVHRVTDDVVRVDAADLVDEDPGLQSVDLH